MVRSANHSEASGTSIFFHSPSSPARFLRSLNAIDRFRDFAGAERSRLNVNHLQVCPSSRHHHLKARFFKVPSHHFQRGLLLVHLKALNR